MWGGVLVRFLCAGRTDVKVLIALSSVAHIRFVVGGLLTGSRLGVKRSRFNHAGARFLFFRFI